LYSNISALGYTSRNPAMKISFRTGFSLLVAALVFLTSTSAAEKTPIQFTSYSVQILPAQAEDPLTSLEYTLSLSSANDERNINSELMLAVEDHGFTHETYFVLEDPFSADPLIFWVVLDIPPFADANGNGIDDFYDVSAQVDSIETIGLHPDENGDPVEYTALWIRGPGESVGSVYLDFPYLGMTFGHQFQLVQYNGEFTFDRAGNNLQGTIALTNIANQEDRILGPLTVQVVNTNTLRLSANTWNNGAGVNFQVVTNFFDGHVSTNFLSYWLLEDGYPFNGVTDYVDWMMVISTGDANGNGVLDLVEGGGTPSERPSLSIARNAAGYEVRITGTAGKTYWLEYTSNVAAAAWPDHHVVTMTGTTQNVTLPADTTGDVFYRLREM
jgi:hypothetical protein